MIINTNIDAMKAFRAFNNNNRKSDKVMEKLSSGMKLNRAADDAAGLTISAKMRAQMRGLSQAERNIEDGLSLLNIADSVIDSITQHTHRIKELAVQAANDTLTDEDRRQLQKEVSQLIEGVDSTTDTGMFNTMRVAAPPIVSVPGTSTSGEVDIVFIVDRTGSMGSIISSVTSNLESFTDTLASYGTDVRLGLVDYADVSPTSGSSIPADDKVIKKTDFTSDFSAFKATLGAITLGHGGDGPESGLEGIMDPAYGGMSFTFRPDASVHFILVTDASSHTTSDGTSSYSIADVGAALVANDITLTLVGSSGAKTQLDPVISATGGSYLDVSTSFASGLTHIAETIAVGAGTTKRLDKIPPVIIQVGPNEGNNIEIQLYDLRAEKIGIDKCSVNPRDNAVKTIGICDGVLNYLGGVRSEYGAYTNRLEHAKNNVMGYNENLTSAESRIRDADMAKEMMELTKTDILQQSGIAMISQANQRPEGVLQLLR